MNSPAWLKKKWADGKKFREWQKTRSNTEEVSVVTTTAEVAALTPDDTIFDTGSGANLAGRGAQARGDAKLINKATIAMVRNNMSNSGIILPTRGTLYSSVVQFMGTKKGHDGFTCQ